jgi:hypothetical protein
MTGLKQIDSIDDVPVCVLRILPFDTTPFLLSLSSPLLCTQQLQQRQGQESILFEDVLCQMMDMINPVVKAVLSIEDMIKPDKRIISGVLFDILFNLHKFMRFETRDPFQEKVRREDIMRSDWDRYAHIEYNRLAQEEESYDSSMEVDALQQQQLADVAGMEQMGGWSLNDDDNDSDSDGDGEGKKL